MSTSSHAGGLPRAAWLLALATVVSATAASALVTTTLAAPLAAPEASSADGAQDLTLLREELAALRGAIEGAVAAVASASGAGPRAIDWEAWGAFAKTWSVDRDAALAEVHFLTMPEVLARFGPPHEAHTNEDGTQWYYDDPGDPATLSVGLRFTDGYVAECWVQL